VARVAKCFKNGKGFNVREMVVLGDFCFVDRILCMDGRIWTGTYMDGLSIKKENTLWHKILKV